MPHPNAGGLRDEQILAIDIVIMSTLSMLGSLFMIFASLHTMFGKRIRSKWLQWKRTFTAQQTSGDTYQNDSGKSTYHGTGPTRASNNRMVLSLALINLFMSVMYIYSQVLYIWLPDGGYVEGDAVSIAICTSQAYLVLSAQWVHMTWQLLFGFNFALRVNTPYLGIRAAKLILRHYVALEIIYHVIAWGMSLSISTFLLLTGGLGRTFFDCWIKKGLFEQFFLYYIPQFVFYGLIFTFYLVTVIVVKHLQTKSRLMNWLPSRIVKEKSSSSVRNILSVRRILRQNRAIFKLNAHLLMYILASAPTLIISVINFIFPDFAPLWLMLLKTSFCLSGFFDSIVFSVNNGYISVKCANKRARQRDNEDESWQVRSSTVESTSSVQYIDFESHVADTSEDMDDEYEDDGDDGDLLDRHIDMKIENPFEERL